MSLVSGKKYFDEAHRSKVDAAPIISEEGIVIVEEGDAVAGKDHASVPQPCEIKKLLPTSLNSLHEHEHDVQERKQNPISATTSLYGSTSTGPLPSTSTSNHPVSSTRRMQQSQTIDRDNSAYQIKKGTTLSPTRGRGEQMDQTSTHHHHHNPSEIDKSAAARGRSGRESSGFAIGAPLSHSRAAAGLMQSTRHTTTAAGETLRPRPDAPSDLLVLATGTGTTARLPGNSTLTSVDLNIGKDVSADSGGTSTEHAGDRDKGKLSSSEASPAVMSYPVYVY